MNRQRLLGFSLSSEVVQRHEEATVATALAVQESGQEQLLSRKRKGKSDAQTVACGMMFDADYLAAGQYFNPKCLRKGDYLSDDLLHSPAARAGHVDGKQDAQTVNQAPAPESPESGQLTPTEHDDEVLATVSVPQQHQLHKKAVQHVPDPSAPGDASESGMLAPELSTQTPAGSVAAAAFLGPTISQRLNPNNAAYDPVFAAEHRARRAQEDPKYLHFKARKQKSKLLKRVHWVRKSKFTAEEHGYLLDLQDHWLQDKDKGKYVSLKAQMQNEQQEFLRVLRSKAFADPTRYPGCHEQAAYQIEAELTARRQTVHALPRMWQMLDVISLLPAAPTKIREPTLMYNGIFSRQGAATTFTLPEPLTHIPLDPPCMPSLLHRIKPPAGTAQAVSSPNPSTSAPDAFAHMPTSASVQPTPATTTHHPTAVAPEPHPAAPGGIQPPGSTPIQLGASALPPSGTSMQSQGGLTGPQPEPQPYQQASYLTQQKAQLQSDPVVQTTAQCMEADLILTEGAYECLTATGLAPGYRGNWEIPFTVQPKPRGPDPKLGDKPDFHLQQVLLDTPLPKRLLNLREKHEMLYQHAVCHLGCSLFSQQQEAAEAAAREGGSAGTHGELPQQEGALDQMLSDDDLDRSSDFEDAPGADPYSPNRDSPYSPSQDRPYSPSNNMLYSHSDGMPSYPGYDANLAEGMTGLTENSSLMPQTAADTASESQPIPTHPGHDFSTSDMPGVPLPAQAASQGGNVAAEERQPGSTQAASQARNTPQEKPQHSSATGYTLATDALPAALPAVSSDNLWAEMETDIDNDVIINHSAGGGAHDSGPQKPAAPQQQEGDAAPGEGTADASRHADGNPEHGEAGLCYQSYKLGGYSIVARAPLPLNVPIKRRLEHRSVPLFQQGAVPPQPAPYTEIRPAVLGVKMEYLEEFGFEMLQPDELSHWWAASSLSPPDSCDVVVAKVGVHSSHLLDIQCIPSQWVRTECSKTGLDLQHPFRIVRLLMRHLQTLPSGQYMLAHQAGASPVTCFRAAPDGLLDGQLVVSEPLPLGPLGLRKTCLYDLHAAHSTTGATDTSQDIFVGAWQQASPDIDQVPFTFPPVHGPSRLGRGKKAKRGAFKNRGPRANGRRYARAKEQGRGFMVHAASAKLLPCQPKPSKGKLKQLQHKQPAVRSAVSAAEYAKALDQEL